MKTTSKNSIIKVKLFTKKIVYYLLKSFAPFSPRVVSLIDGGLGSQMWQFALGYSVAQRNKLPLTLNLDFYKNCGKDLNGNNNRQFLLFSAFPAIKRLYENSIETSKLFQKCYADNTMRSTYDYNPELFSLEQPIYLSQYYANVKYILDYRSDLRTMFDMKPNLSSYEKRLFDQIRETNSCSVHIRKGDFVGRYVDVCTDYYYISAIKTATNLNGNIQFFIFSNDESYFTSHILPHCGNIKFNIIEGRSEENPCVDFYLMKECKNSIISNSGFSWMAAFLREDAGFTIMPDHWNNDPNRIEASKNAFHVSGWIKQPTA